ncbi:MAG: methyltransferase domain-containing protein [Candidatus Thorarchaeota archaeon]
MKLNIGCGLEYKKGYVNIDAFDNTVADRLMSVTNLEFDDQFFSHIACIQVLEHLGAAKSIYALSEIYRVLTTEGTFLLETPDLVNSFKSFIKGDEDNRKLIMNWIYGLDTPGMSHKYGFPKELLERMLHEAGFIDIKIVQLNPKSIHPSLRATCKKGNSRIYQVISQFRKTIIEGKQVNLDHQVEVIEKEVLIQDLVQLTLNAGTTLGERYLKTIVETSSICSPKIGRVFLDCISEAELTTHVEIRDYVGILEKLDSMNFVNVLIHILSELPILPGQQSESYASVLKMGKQIVGKFIAKDQIAIDEITNTSKKIQNYGNNDFFSSVGLEIISNKQLSLGLKAFGLDQIDNATKLIHDAIRLNRDSITAFWNLARISVLNQNTESALQYYSTVRNLLMLRHPKNYRSHMKNVDNERRAAEEGKGEMFSRPLYSY